MPTDPLSLTFAGSFLVGLLFLLVISFMGHDFGHDGHGAHHDGGDGGFSFFAFFNPLSITLFLIGFGFFGFVFHETTALELPIVFTIAGASGLIIAIGIIILLSRLFGGDTTISTVQDVSDRTGLLGKVNVTIPEGSIGEVIYISPGGLRKSIPARSIDGQRLERGQEVVVVSYQKGIAEVDTWERFVNQEEQSSLAISDADEMATLRALLEESDQKSNQYVIEKETQKE